jgi:hypothetical protein
MSETKYMHFVFKHQIHIEAILIERLSESGGKADGECL